MKRLRGPRQSDLFGWRRPRAVPRLLAHAVDVGDHGCVYSPGMTMVALFVCARCGWESGWLERPNMTATKKGIACGVCNSSDVAASCQDR